MIKIIETVTGKDIDGIEFTLMPRGSRLVIRMKKQKRFDAIHYCLLSYTNSGNVSLSKLNNSDGTILNVKPDYFLSLLVQLERNEDINGVISHMREMVNKETVERMECKYDLVDGKEAMFCCEHSSSQIYDHLKVLPAVMKPTETLVNEDTGVVIVLFNVDGKIVAIGNDYIWIPVEDKKYWLNVSYGASKNTLDPKSNNQYKTNTKENKKLVAQYDNQTQWLGEVNSGLSPSKELNYSSDWNDLMRVIDKIFEEPCNKFNENLKFMETEIKMSMTNRVSENRMETVYMYVVDYIKQHTHIKNNVTKTNKNC